MTTNTHAVREAVLQSPAGLEGERHSRALAACVSFGCAALAAMCVAAIGGSVRLAAYIYLVTSVGIGLTLAASSPLSFSAFALSLWFVTPLCRRAFEWNAGWDPFNVTMLAPHLVVLGAAALLLWRRVLTTGMPRPILVICASVFYALAVGIARNGFTSACFDLLDWAVPPVFAAVLLTQDRCAPLSTTLAQTFVVGTGLMGAYSLLQFAAPPPWDVHWMQHAPIASIGSPEPFLVRVFSSMNSPVPYAVATVAGLMLLPVSRGRLRWLAGPPAAAGLLLTLVRFAWVALVLGALFVLFLSPQTLRPVARLFLLVLATFLLSLTLEPLSARILPRAATLVSLEHDASLAARASSYSQVGRAILEQPFGSGLGSTGASARMQASAVARPYDNLESGFLNIFFSLGLIGGFIHVLATVAMLLCLVRRAAAVKSPMSAACAGATLSLFLSAFFSNTLIGVQGIIFWSLLALGLSSPQAERLSSIRSA